MERRIHVINLFKNQAVGAGSNGLSQAIDLRDYSKQGQFSLYISVGPCGTNATCGSAVLSYQGAPWWDGTYITPTGGTFGTVAVGTGGSDFITFTPPVIPFMKINVNVGTNGSENVTALLNVR